MDTIIADLDRYAGGSIIARVYNILFNENFQLTVLYRIAHFLDKLHLTLFCKIIHYFYKIVFSCDIDYRCEIGSGIRILHGLAIVIGRDVVIGNNCTIYQCVTFAGRNKSRIINGKETNFPVVGNNCTVFTGAVLYGPIQIGNDCIIGANSYVDKDLPDGSIFHN